MLLQCLLQLQHIYFCCYQVVVLKVLSISNKLYRIFNTTLMMDSNIHEKSSTSQFSSWSWSKGYGSTTTMRAPMVPSVPGDGDSHSNTWLVDMNYLMPFSVMLMILCVLLLILCYLRHRMRQRRLLQRELQLRRLMTSAGPHQHVDGKI